MPLESGTYISDLVATNPVGATDQKAEGDDHIRLLKATIKNTFPNVTGAVTGTHAQLNSAAAAFGASNVPLLNAANTFTGQLTLSNTGPVFFLHDSDAGTNQKYYGFHTSASQFIIYSALDDTAFHETALSITKNTSGEITQVALLGDEIELNATLLDFNGAADFSSTVHTGAGIIASGEAIDIGQVGQFAFLDVTGGNGRVGSYNFDTATWQPLLVYGSTVEIGVPGTTTEIDLTATDIDINGNLDVDGATPDINGSSNLGLHGGGSDISLAASGITLDADGGGATIFLDGGINQITITTDVFFVNGAAVHFDDITTSASAANAFLDSTDDNRLYRSTSSIAYKKDIENLDSKDYAKILGLRPIRYHSKAVADDPSREFVGLIAEEVAEVDPRLVHFHKGKPDGVMYDRVTVGLIGIVREQQKAIDDLRREIDRLKH